MSETESCSEQCTMRAEVNKLRAEVEKWKTKANEIAERAIDLRQYNERLIEEKRATARMIAAECSDPNGTIWDHAKELQAEVERLRGLLSDCEDLLLNSVECFSGSWKQTEDCCSRCGLLHRIRAEAAKCGKGE